MHFALLLFVDELYSTGMIKANDFFCQTDNWNFYSMNTIITHAHRVWTNIDFSICRYTQTPTHIIPPGNAYKQYISNVPKILLTIMIVHSIGCELLSYVLCIEKGEKEDISTIQDKLVLMLSINIHRQRDNTLIESNKRRRENGSKNALSIFDDCKLCFSFYISSCIVFIFERRKWRKAIEYIQIRVAKNGNVSEIFALCKNLKSIEFIGNHFRVFKYDLDFQKY